MAEENEFKKLMAAWGGAPTIIVNGHLCRMCGKAISTSAPLHGKPEVGYTCEECIVKESDNLQWLSRKLTEEADVENTIIRPGSAFACVFCGSVDSEYYMEAAMDGRIGYVCAGLIPMSVECERKWFQLNREKVGVQLQYELKLK
jgi:hypothetical protein